jgi:predicted GNAT family acetyltransferase
MLPVPHWAGNRVFAGEPRKYAAEVVMENEPVKNELMQRYELHLEGKVAVLAYELQREGVVAFTHTFVPPELRGKNVAAILTKFALDDVRSQGKKVVPQCSYVATYLERNKEYADLRAASSPLSQ